MIARLRITVLADNCVAHPVLLGEHGLALLIEAGGWCILFDAGRGKVLRGNAIALGVDLAELDAVVLSHGHSDHTAGLADLLRDSSPAAIYLHPAVTQAKYARRENAPPRFIGTPEPSRQALSALRNRVLWTESATEVVPGVWCTGGIPRLPANGPGESGFFLDPECREPDPLADDQALFIETADGLVIVAGCAHAGVANTLDRVAALTGRNQFFGLVGGLHLFRAATAEMEASADAIRRRNLRAIAPCHCTGIAAKSYLRTRFSSLVRDVGAGARLHFGEP